MTSSPPRNHARSIEEARLYMMVHPCSACGRETPHLGHRLVARGDDLVTIYEGPCPGCPTQRRFELVIVEPFAPPATAEAIVFGDGVSTLLDAAQFVLAAELLARGVPVEVAGLDARARAARADRLRMAIGALDEAIKLVPAGADAVPAAMITSAEGRALYAREPGRLQRIRMVAVRRAFVGLL